MSESENCPATNFVFVETADGSWELSSEEEPGKVLAIFETRRMALDFAQSLMDDSGPWRIVFQRER